MKLALSRALTGLSSALNSRLVSTSPMPPGGVAALATLLSTRVEGHRLLAITADDGGRQGAEQIEGQHRTDMGGLVRCVIGDGRRHQEEHQHRRNGFQGANEQLAEDADLAAGLRKEQGQENAGDQADKNLQDQAGAGEQLQERALNHDRGFPGLAMAPQVAGRLTARACIWAKVPME